MDLDFFDCFGKKKLSYNQRNTVSQNIANCWSRHCILILSCWDTLATVGLANSVEADQKPQMCRMIWLRGYKKNFHAQLS